MERREKEVKVRRRGKVELGKTGQERRVEKRRKDEDKWKRI